MEIKFLHDKTEYKKSVMKELMMDIMNYVSQKLENINKNINFNKCVDYFSKNGLIHFVSWKNEIVLLHSCK